ncbi:hypothetical protein NC651_006426 [Populus alba x Populus x berolinensis]|nr:hypothetical protein NC651_006426 [Populus alba x Populus x berolinensis]
MESCPSRRKRKRKNSNTSGMDTSITSAYTNDKQDRLPLAYTKVG